MLKMKHTDGWGLSDLSANLTLSDSAELTEDQKRPCINFSCSAASKVLTLGLADGQTALVTNIGGTNAVTVKNVSGDTGTSVAAGKCAIVIASTTADGSKVYVLN